MSVKRFVSVAVILLCTSSLASCANTVRGVGKDVKGTVDAIEDTVN